MKLDLKKMKKEEMLKVVEGAFNLSSTSIELIRILVGDDYSATERADARTQARELVRVYDETVDGLNGVE